jgi:hypothetical protein
MTLNKETAASRYGVGHETAIAVTAVDACKAGGTVAVRYEAKGHDGPGFYINRVRFDGSRGLEMGPVKATEEEAWLYAAVRLAYYKPGVLQMTSREFGPVYKSNVELRQRLEIRKISGKYEVFRFECQYQDGKEPRDINQSPQDVVFATLAEAAGYVGDYIADYEGAAADDREAALEAHFEREREDDSLPKEPADESPGLGM